MTRTLKLPYIVGGTQYPIFSWFFMKLFSNAYKSWGHDPIWYFPCLCRKFSEFSALLFACLSSLKIKFRWTENNFWLNNFWLLIRKIFIQPFLDYKSSWSKKSTPIQPRGVIGVPITMYFQKMQSLRVFSPFLQRSLGNAK